MTHISSANSSRKWWIAGLLAVAVLVALIALQQMPDEAMSSIPSYPVQQGEFVISLKLKGGQLEAVEAENIVAPRVRGSAQNRRAFPRG